MYRFGKWLISLEKKVGEWIGRGFVGWSTAGVITTLTFISLVVIGVLLLIIQVVADLYPERTVWALVALSLLYIFSMKAIEKARL